jgi:hypothetical protein
MEYCRLQWTHLSCHLLQLRDKLKGLERLRGHAKTQAWGVGVLVLVWSVGACGKWCVGAHVRELTLANKDRGILRRKFPVFLANLVPPAFF